MKKAFIKRRKRVVPAPANGQTHAFVQGHPGSSEGMSDNGPSSSVNANTAIPSRNELVRAGMLNDIDAPLPRNMNIDPSLTAAASSTLNSNFASAAAPALQTSPAPTSRKRILAIDFTGYQTPTIPKTLPPLPLDPDYDLRPAKRQRGLSGSSSSTQQHTHPHAQAEQQSHTHTHTHPHSQSQTPLHQHQHEHRQQLPNSQQQAPSPLDDDIFDPTLFIDPQALTVAQARQRSLVLQEQAKMLQNWILDLEARCGSGIGAGDR